MDQPSPGKPIARIGLQELFKAREKESLKWIASPLQDLEDKEFKSFHVRHEASAIELFFDLFFVANLATFTAYHNITTTGNVAAYIGFFLILWSTWFQVTIFDVRFANDSVFERFCKLCQFITFTVFAAVGANFNPGTYESAKYYRVYQTMAAILAFSRLLLAIQYAIVAGYICSKHRNLIIPMILMIATFLISGACLAGTLVGFKAKSISSAHVGWWIILPVESIIIMTISSVWRKLSFKESHINERLSLLTMIIIGEGVIGITKTVGYLWPTETAPTAGNIIAIFSIVVMLLLIWQMYFDNHYNVDCGTIKQQWWALGHFFLHMGIVGMVEGSNRMAVIYQAIDGYKMLYETVTNLCQPGPTVSRQAFVSTMNYTLQYLKLDTYDPRSYDWTEYYLNRTLYPSVTPRFCDLDNSYSEAVVIEYYLTTGIFKRYGIDAAPRDEGYYKTFRTVYTYLWLSVALMMFIMLLFVWIVRSKKHDTLEWIRMAFRLLVAIIAVGIALLNFVEVPFGNFISSPVVVSAICVLISLTLTMDRICRWLGVRSFNLKYATPPPDAPGHGHGHSHGHDDHGDGSIAANDHNSMAFGSSDRGTNLTKTMFSEHTYEMVPIGTPGLGAASGTVISPARQYTPQMYHDIQPAQQRPYNYAQANK